MKAAVVGGGGAASVLAALAMGAALPPAVLAQAGAPAPPIRPGGAGGEQVVLELPQVPLPGQVIEDEEVTRRLEEVQAEIDLLAEEVGATSSVTGWPDLSEVAELDPIRNVIHPRNQSIPLLTTTLRHTTIQLPSDESIVDFVVGDSVYFDIRGADNVAFIKGMDNERRTNLSLVTDRNRTYSFDVFSTSEHRPDEVLVVDWWQRDDADPQGGPVSMLVPGFDPAGVDLGFTPASVLADYDVALRRAEEDVFRIEEEAAREEARIRDLGSARVADYLAAYPRRVQLRYRLSDEIRAAPLHVTQIWTDGQFTYIRSRSEESPAIYSLTGVEGEEPVFVNFELTPDGLYVVDHVLGAGYAQLHGARGEWYLWDVPPLSMLSEIALPRGDDPPSWVETRGSKGWIRRHPKLFTGLVIAGVAGTWVTWELVR